MIISGGQAKGIPLEVPKGIEIRPSTQANRERLFSSLGERILGINFLDLFAGTGSYGLEALSRGAKSGHFVEKNRKAIQSIKKNHSNICKSASLSLKNAHVHQRDVSEFLKKERVCYDIIFLDPPYPLFKKIGKSLFAQIRKNYILKKDGLLIHEISPEMESNFEGWTIFKIIGNKKKIGSPYFRIYKLL